MYEALCVNIIDQCIRAGIISQEDFCTECIKAGFFDGANIQNLSAKKKVVNYLSSHTTMSNTNLTNWCKKHNIRLNAYLTLENCLRLRAFAFKQRRGTRLYYCKSPASTAPITEEMICLR